MFSSDPAIDLGTANTLICPRSRHRAELFYIRTSANKKSVVAVGTEVKRMLGRTPGNIAAIRPMKEGVIADFTAVRKDALYFTCPRTTLCNRRRAC
jgi:rod shape-determining protein MreB